MKNSLPLKKNMGFASYGMYILSLLIFGTNGLLVSAVSLQSSHIVLLRTLIGGALLSLIVLIKGGFDKKSIFSEKIPLLLGGIALGLNWITLFEAYKSLNVSLSTLIYYIGPIIVLLLSPLIFKEKLSAKKLLCAFLVVIGLILISGSIILSGMQPIGLVNAFLSAAFYALLIIFNKKIVKTGGLQTAAIELIVAFFVVLIYSLITSGLPVISLADAPYIAVLGIINTGTAYALYFSGMRNLSGQSAALISYIDPVSALIFSALFLNERMNMWQLAGAALIIGGAILGEIKAKKAKEML